MKYIEMLGMLLRHGRVRLSAGETSGAEEARDSVAPEISSLYMAGLPVAVPESEPEPEPEPEPEDIVRRNALFRAGPWQQK